MRLPSVRFAPLTTLYNIPLIVLGDSTGAFNVCHPLTHPIRLRPIKCRMELPGRMLRQGVGVHMKLPSFRV